MFDYIPITYLNDFIFCPRSIYFHQLCGDKDQSLYHRQAQTNGKAKHESIENSSYSNRKDVLQGIYVYCQKYKLCGKIDLFDLKKETLSERKAKIKVIYDGYIFQLYAQYFALQEMGYKISKLKLYSYQDNKTHEVLLPSEDHVMMDKFEKTIDAINNFDFGPTPEAMNIQKCLNCIYEPLCDISVC